MLHTPQYDVKNRAFCGPTAISAVANVPISKVRKMVRRYRNDRRRHFGIGPRKRKSAIMSMTNSELLTVMRRLKFKVTPHTGDGMTLRQLCDDIGHTGPFIVEVTGHYVAISHGMICDTLTRVPVPFSEYKHKKCKVKRYWRFTKPKQRRKLSALDRRVADIKAGRITEGPALLAERFF